MVHNETPLIDFNATDRCDRCGAQALSLARHEEYGELMFCLHHRKKFYDNMLDEGWQIVDDYAAISQLTGAEPVYPAPV